MKKVYICLGFFVLQSWVMVSDLRLGAFFFGSSNSCSSFGNDVLQFINHTRLRRTLRRRKVSAEQNERKGHHRQSERTCGMPRTRTCRTIITHASLLCSIHDTLDDLTHCPIKRALLPLSPIRIHGVVICEFLHRHHGKLIGLINLRRNY